MFFFLIFVVNKRISDFYFVKNLWLLPYSTISSPGLVSLKFGLTYFSYYRPGTHFANDAPQADVDQMLYYCGASAASSIS